MSSSSIDAPAAPPHRRFGLGAFTITVAATVLLLVTTSLALPVDPYIRWQSLNGTIYNRAQWIYERIHYDPAPIDVVFLGSSREGAGVYPTLLEPALAARGLDLRVANFALPSTGFDIRDTIAEEVIKQKHPKLLVFSVVEAFPRDGHEAFGDLASETQVFGAPWLVNRNLPANLLRLPLRQIGLWAATLAPGAFGRQAVFDPAHYAGTTLDPRATLDFTENLDGLATAEHANELARQAAIRRRQLTPPLLPANLSWIEFGVSQTYVERLLRLADEHDVKVVFLFLPFFTGPEAPIEASWLEERAPLWNAGFMRDDPLNYVDSGHSAASPRVKQMLTDWMADNIAGVL